MSIEEFQACVYSMDCVHRSRELKNAPKKLNYRKNVFFPRPFKECSEKN